MPQTKQHVRKRLPKWIPKTMTNQWKSGSGHTCHHWASLWHPWEGSGGTPGTKMYQNVKNMLVQNLLRKEKERCCLKTFLLASFFSAADWAKPTWINWINWTHRHKFDTDRHKSTQLRHKFDTHPTLIRHTYDKSVLKNSNKQQLITTEGSHEITSNHRAA